MSLLEAIILGIVQGLTEFLPVSSSGHIELAQKLLGADDLKEQEELLSVVLHAATALSTIFVFKKDISVILKGLFAKQKAELMFSLAIIISMVPAAIIGLKFDSIIESFFEGDLLLVGSMLLVTAVLLFLADKAKNTNKSVSPTNAFIIGIAQAIAILPGISRSGATVSTSVLLGIDRGRAARFSFLMVVPLILGKMSKDIVDGKMVLSSELAMPLGVGFITSFITGIIACVWMVKLVKQTKLKWFSLYCLVVGIISITFSL
ncbi:MAG: undecaprenyl-diphosphate phosphatase [Flavobacteriales bacterium]|nr:undecaprenyl-diphosphate phosphatase [Flavobacteriales bacterium]